MDRKVHLHADIPAKSREWRNDPSIFRWCRQHTLIDEESHQRWLEKISCDPTIKMFGLISPVERTDSTLPVTKYDLMINGRPYRYIGVAGFTAISLLNHSAEFSLYIAPEFQKNGFGKRALCNLLAHGFLEWGFVRIWGETLEYNKAFKMFTDIGMKHEGTLRSTYWKDGRWHDSHIISMLRHEFDATNGNWKY